MDRAERLAWIDQLEAENARTLEDMARRRAYREQHGEPEMWRVPDDEIRRKSASVDGIVRKVNSAALIEAPVPPVTPDELRAALNTFADIVGSETGLIERRIVTKQNEDVAALRVEISVLRNQLAELVNVVEALAVDVSELQSDVGDALDRGSKISWLRKRGNVSAA